MKTLTLLAAFAVAASIVPMVNAEHDDGCEYQSADPATINQVDLPDGTILYVEERGVPEPLNTSPPIPFSGFILADGTWIYQESNTVPGMQRGGSSGPCLPSDDLCITSGVDPINDENCGHGPDIILF